MKRDLSPRFSASRWRYVWAGAAAFLSASFLSGIFTTESLPYWGNSIGQFASFVVGGYVATLVTPNHAPAAVGIALGLTWGAAATYVLVDSLIGSGPIGSAILILGYLAAAVLTASAVEIRRLRRASN